MRITNPKVDAFFEGAKRWKDEMLLLRQLVLECGLDEDYKWRHPCYTINGKNVVIIHGFKEYFALLFFKGVLLEDPEKIMIQQTENVQSGRHLRFNTLEEVEELAPIIKQYVFEAVEVEKSGAKVPMKKTQEFPVVEELQAVFDAKPEVKEAFYALTPGRQRGYLLFFSQAKQSKTRESRIEKSLPAIFKGKGLHD